MIKVTVQQNTIGTTGVSFTMLKDGKAEWVLKRNLNPENGQYWWPISEGEENANYFMFTDDVTVEVLPSKLPVPVMRAIVADQPPA